MFPPALAACADAEGGSVPSVVEQLDQAATMPFDMPSCQAELDGRLLPLLGGSITLQSTPDGQVELDGLEAHVADFAVSGEDPHLDGIKIANVRVSLAEPVVLDVAWTPGGDAGFGDAVVDLNLDWSLVTPKGVVPLSTQHLLGIGVHVDLFTATDGTLHAIVEGQKAGVVWSWAGLVTLEDLRFELRASN